MPNTTEKKPLRKWPFILFGLLLAIAGTGYYFYNKYIADNRWKPLLQEQLKELVLRSSDSLYHIEYKDFDLNLTSGTATVKNFTLTPDTNVYNHLVAEKKAPDNLFTLTVEKLTINNVGARKAYQEKDLEISSIKIERPNLTVVNKRLPFNDTVKVGKPKTPYQLISKVFKKLHIDSILLKDISLNYINRSNPETKQTALKHLDININDIYVDSLSNRDTSRFYYTKGVELRLHDFKMATADSLYYVKLKQLFFSTSEQKIVLDNVALQPRYSKKDFYEAIDRPMERFDLSFKRIAINKIDLQQFLRNQKLYAGAMDVRGADVEIYNNNAYKGAKKNKRGKDPHQQLQKVALDMRLNRLNLYQSNIRYAEADAKTGYTGVILFNSTSGYFTNVTNDDAAKKRDRFMMAHLTTHFMSAGILHVNFKFDLNSPTGAFNYSGTLGKFDGRVLDKLVKPLALIHVRRADVQRLNFNVNANNYFAKGNLQFYYKNLDVELLKKEEGVKPLQNQDFISGLANELVIVDDNPDLNGKFRPGPIYLRRAPTMSFFSLLYKALLDGLKPSVGFDEKTEQRVNKTVNKVNNIITKFNRLKEKLHIGSKNGKAKKEAEQQKQKQDR